MYDDEDESDLFDGPFNDFSYDPFSILEVFIWGLVLVIIFSLPFILL